MKGSIQKHGLSLKRNRPERVTIAFIGWVCLVLVCSIGCARGQDAGKEKKYPPENLGTGIVRGYCMAQYSQAHFPERSQGKSRFA